MTQRILNRLAEAWKAILAVVAPIVIAALTDIITDVSMSWGTALATSVGTGAAVYAKSNRS